MNFEALLPTLVASALAMLPAVASAQDYDLYDDDFFAQLDSHLAVVTDNPNDQLVSGGVGYAGRAGWRWGRWGAFGEIGQAAWFATGIRRDFSAGVLNIGVGGEYRFHDGQVRISLAGGTSTLLFDTVLDPAGTTGWYANIRPGGLRWGLSESLALELNPVTFMVMQPVTRGERLTKLEYQAVIALEFQ